MASFYLATAIDYVNGKPHLGHAYEKVLADTIARYRRACGDDVFFLTGVDEHGQKVQQSAKAKGLDPQQFCDGMAETFRQTWEKLDISYSRFVRTTSDKHKQVVQGFLQKLKDDGLIYFKEHEGFYSVRQEQFVTEKDMVDGKFPEIFGEVVRTKEPNYYFKLSQFREQLLAALESNKEWIIPTFRTADVRNFCSDNLDDLCISRPKSRLEWGIPLPFDENFVTYVWFDALTNYASYADIGTDASRWPCDLQIIGKDILVPAHGVYWNIMLLALGLPVPRAYLVHGWWQMQGAKISKSTGQVVDPLDLVGIHGADAFRYFVMREMVVGQDADFTTEQFERRYASDLANDLGNLVNRSISMIARYRESVCPACAIHSEMAAAAADAVREYRERMDRYEIHAGLERAWRLVQRCNQFVDEQAPWKKAKDPALTGELDCVLATLAEMVRILGILVAPVMPSISVKIFAQLGRETPQTSMADALPGTSLGGHTLGKAEPLFPRIEPAPAA